MRSRRVGVARSRLGGAKEQLAHRRSKSIRQHMHHERPSSCWPSLATAGAFNPKASGRGGNTRAIPIEKRPPPGKEQEHTPGDDTSKRKARIRWTEKALPKVACRVSLEGLARMLARRCVPACPPHASSSLLSSRRQMSTIRAVPLRCASAYRWMSSGACKRSLKLPRIGMNKSM